MNTIYIVTKEEYYKSCHEIGCYDTTTFVVQAFNSESNAIDKVNELSCDVYNEDSDIKIEYHVHETNIE